MRTFAAWVRALRPHHWAKNLLIFVPVFTSHSERVLSMVQSAALAFVAFCLCASALYLFNDLRDIENDRAHPVRKNRPLAAGLLSPGLVWASLPLPLGAAYLICLAVPGLWPVLTIYAFGSASYSLFLKRLAVVDTVTLACLYTLRVLAGHAVTGIEYSAWLLTFCMFTFLSLALMKRVAELRRAGGTAPGRGYQADDLPILAMFGAASAMVAMLVFAFYIDSSRNAQRLYQHPHLLWLIAPLLASWMMRAWLITWRGEMDSDPIRFALRDAGSLVTAALIVVVALLARG